MSNKAIALTAAAILSSTTGLAYANGAIYVPHYWGNFYLGGGVSADTGSFRTRQTTEDSTVARNGRTFASDYVRKQFDWRLNGIGGQIFAGYGYLWEERFWFALEGWSGISSNEGNFRATATSTNFDLRTFIDPRLKPLEGETTISTSGQMEQHWSAGVSFLPGFRLLDNTTVFVRLGWVVSEFEMKGKVDGMTPVEYLVLQADPTVFVGAPLHRSLILNGIQAGLGMQSMITQHIGIRGEWDWSQFNDFVAKRSRAVDFGKAGDPATKLAAYGTFTQFSVRDPQVDQFKLSLVYDFAAA